MKQALVHYLILMIEKLVNKLSTTCKFHMTIQKFKILYTKLK